MPKTKLKTLETIQDIKYFEATHHNNVEIKFVADIDEIFHNDDYVPVLCTATILNDFSVAERIKCFLDQSQNNKILLFSLTEGYGQIKALFGSLDIMKYYDNGQIYSMIGGDMPPNCPHANIHTFTFQTFNLFNQQITLEHHAEIFQKNKKPYNFLFLNKNARDHRKKLLNLLNEKQLLNNALWSDLSQGVQVPPEYPDFFNNIFYNPIKSNEAIFSTDSYLLLNHQLYIDTYFTVVTETIFTEPWQCFTEKTYKPIMMGHPFILVSGPGAYKKLHEYGYKTFDGLIDESFDSILDDSLRLEKIAESIEKLCSRNLEQFLIDAEQICKHNRMKFYENLGKNLLENYNNVEKLLEQLSCQNN